MSDDARARFVAAMRILKQLPGYQNAKEIACDAFADAECGEGLAPTENPECYGSDDRRHPACRAALRKEVFGE